MLGRSMQSRAPTGSSRGDGVPFWRRLWRSGGANPSPHDVPAAEEPRLDRSWDRPTANHPVRRAAAAAPAADPTDALRDAFTPRQPKRWRDQFVGRVREIDRALMAIIDEQAHVVLFGDRGRGKTSLSNVVTEKLVDRGYFVVRCASSAEVTFEALFRQLLQRIPADRLDYRAALSDGPAALLPPTGFGAAEVTDVARHLGRGRVLMIIDEFDRVADPAVRMRVADTIKSLSDARSRLQLLIVGVASSLEHLLGAHPSIERNVVGIHVPLMDAAELEAVVTSGAAAAAISFERAVLDAIVALSQGLPYCAQLFSLYAGRCALQRGRRIVAWPDLCEAAASVLSEMTPSVGAVFEHAIAAAEAGAGRPEDWLLRIARAEADSYGLIGRRALAASLEAVPEPERRAAFDWIGSDCGRQILATVPGAGVVFSNSLMRQYILLRDFAGGGRSPAPTPTPGHTSAKIVAALLRPSGADTPQPEGELA